MLVIVVAFPSRIFVSGHGDVFSPRRAQQAVVLEESERRWLVCETEDWERRVVVMRDQARRQSRVRVHSGSGKRDAAAAALDDA